MEKQFFDCRPLLRAPCQAFLRGERVREREREIEREREREREIKRERDQKREGKENRIRTRELKLLNNVQNLQ